MVRYFFKKMIPLVVLITCVFGVLYGAVQQDIRMSANDPQIQMAEDTATALGRGQAISLPPATALSESIAPFIILFDKGGKPVSSSATLNGQIPTLPQGVFTFTDSHAGDRFTWQPHANVRLAAVVVPYNKGYVLAGRSLREVEIREAQLFLQVFAGWVVTLVATAISVLFAGFVFPKRNK